MLIRKFEKTVSEIVGQKIELFELLDQTAKKWYDKKYNKCNNDSEIKLNFVYGVCIDNSSIIEFDFKVGKTIESLLKTFITQYTTKVSEYEVIDGVFTKLSKEQKLKKIVEKNQERVHFGLFYTTLYGIGLWDFFNSRHSHEILTKKMNDFLQSKNIEYKNEYSEAGWVYRYKINLNITDTNKLLKSFENGMA